MQRTDFNSSGSGGTVMMGGNSGVPTQALGTIPKFYMDTVIDGVASREKGHVVYTEVEMVLILFAGTNNQTVRRKVLDHDRQTYRDAYRAFKDSMDDRPLTGTPITEWAHVSRATAETLRMRNIRTVEELANLHDGQIMDLGMGGRQLVNDAIAYLKIRSGTADAMAMSRQMEDMQAQLDRLSAANRQLEGQLDAAERSVQLAAAVAGRNVTPDQIQQSFTPSPRDEPTDPGLDAMLLEANGLDAGNVRAMAEVQRSSDERQQQEDEKTSGRKPRGRAAKAKEKVEDLKLNVKPIEAE